MCCSSAWPHRILGQGAYGIVALGFDTVENKAVAIKKLMGIFDHPLSAKRTLRELKIQQVRTDPLAARLGALAQALTRATVALLRSRTALESPQHLASA